MGWNYISVSVYVSLPLFLLYLYFFLYRFLICCIILPIFTAPRTRHYCYNHLSNFSLQIMTALKEEEQMNRDLRGYIGQILTKIIENHPNLLEIKPRTQSVSSVCSFNSYSWPQPWTLNFELWTMRRELWSCDDVSRFENCPMRMYFSTFSLDVWLFLHRRYLWPGFLLVDHRWCFLNAFVTLYRWFMYYVSKVTILWPRDGASIHASKLELSIHVPHVVLNSSM